MNDEEFSNMMLISQTYKHMCISISEYCDFLEPEKAHFIDSVVDQDILRTGLYGYIGKCYLWVSPITGAGSVRVSNAEIDRVNIREGTGKWSLEIPLALANPEYLERVLNLKAFW
jgi:hypothetical protein